MSKFQSKFMWMCEIVGPLCGPFRESRDCKAAHVSQCSFKSSSSCPTQHHPSEPSPKRKGSAKPKSAVACLPSSHPRSYPVHTPSAPMPVPARSGKGCRVRCETADGSGCHPDRRWFADGEFGFFCGHWSISPKSLVPGLASRRQASSHKCCIGFTICDMAQIHVEARLAGVWVPGRHIN